MRRTESLDLRRAAAPRSRREAGSRRAGSPHPESLEVVAHACSLPSRPAARQPVDEVSARPSRQPGSRTRIAARRRRERQRDAARRRVRSKRAPASGRPTSRQPHDLAVVVEVDARRCRRLGQTRHRAHRPADRIDETCADRRAHLADFERVTGRCALERRVARDRQMGLRDADRHRAEPVVLVGLELLAGRSGVLDPLGAVDRRRDLLDLALEAVGVVVEEVEAALLVTRLDDGLGKRRRAGPAVGEVGAHRHASPHVLGDPSDHRRVRWRGRSGSR